MQFPESWLREFCNPALSSQQLADTLTMGGLEVEELTSVAPPFSKVVVAHIREVMAHPNADKLRLCQVDVGSGALLSIVCGAPNARVDIKVPCALVGAQLPPAEDGGAPFLIKVGKLRGVESQGMLCSARELKLSEDHAGLLELPADAPVGQDLRHYLRLDDQLLTLKLTPNLAHCLSVHGVARELSALTGAALHQPVFKPAVVSDPMRLPVQISAPDLCGRFSGRVIRHLNPRAVTPAWMVERLARCGQRSVSALVDISNYVMFELGRPSHIFDLDKIHGGLQVRWGRRGESLKLLNGQTVSLDETVGVIADERQVESLAGIMGGDATAVSDETTQIYVEAAFWWPRAIAGRSRRFNFATDAGHRFERGVDPATTVEHIERITELVLQICGTEQTRCGPIDDQMVDGPISAPVTLRVARACKVIGMSLSQAQCVQALQRLGLRVEQEGEGLLTVTPPSYRFDLQIEEDLIEEVARLIGFEALPETPPQAPITARLRPESERSAYALRRSLAALGYQETINFSFVQERWEHELAGNPSPIRLLNPIASPMSVMRSSLMGSLLQVLRFNQDRKADRLRVFEVGRIFRHDASVPESDSSVAGIDQPLRVAGLASGWLEPAAWSQPSRAVDFFDVKGDLEALLWPGRPVFEPCTHPALHPGRSARIVLDGREIGVIGQLHPRWRQSYELSTVPVLFELDHDALIRRPVPVFSPVSRQQPVERDIAVVVAEAVTHDQLMAQIHAAPTGGLLRSATLFDVYRPPQGEGAQKSLAVRLVLCDEQATLTDEQIDQAVRAVVETLQSRLGARLRA